MIEMKVIIRVSRMTDALIAEIASGEFHSEPVFQHKGCFIDACFRSDLFYVLT